jgi:hypothetical protein
MDCCKFGAMDTNVDVSEVRPAYIIALMMEAVSTSETPVYFHETTRRYLPESCHLHTRRHENLKSQGYEYVYASKRGGNFFYRILVRMSA